MTSDFVSPQTDLKRHFLFVSPADPTRIRAGWRVIIHFTIFFLLMIVFVLVFDGVASLIIGGHPRNRSLLVVYAMVLATVLTTMFAAKRLDHRPMRDYGLAFDKRWLRDYMFGFAAAAVQMTLIFAFLASGGWIHFTIARGATSISLALLSGFVLHLGVGFEEELMTRGYQLLNIEEGFRGWMPQSGAAILAVIVTSVFFGFLHAGNPYASTVSDVNLIFAGISLAAPVLLTRQLGMSMGAHTAWNFFQGPVFGMAVSGNHRFASLFITTSGGPEVLTGGAFGPEAGVVSLVAEALFIVAAILYVRMTRGRASILPPPVSSPSSETPEHLPQSELSKSQEAQAPAATDR